VRNSIIVVIGIHIILLLLQAGEVVSSVNESVMLSPAVIEEVEDDSEDEDEYGYTKSKQFTFIKSGVRFHIYKVLLTYI